MRGTFELFQTGVMNYIETSRGCNKIITRDLFLLKAFELIQKYRGFEIDRYDRQSLDVKMYV